MCEIIQWLSIFFGLAIRHNLQCYQYHQYLRIPIPLFLILLVYKIVQWLSIYFCFAVCHFSISSFLFLPDIWIHLEDIWTHIADRMLSTPCHQLMNTNYQFVPAMQMIAQCNRATYGKSYKRCGGNIRHRGNQCDIAGDKIMDYPCSSIITSDYHIAIYNFSLIIESVDKSR